MDGFDKFSTPCVSSNVPNGGVRKNQSIAGSAPSFASHFSQSSTSIKPSSSPDTNDMGSHQQGVSRLGSGQVWSLTGLQDVLAAMSPPPAAWMMPTTSSHSTQLGHCRGRSQLA